MAIKGRRPIPQPIAAALGIENNQGKLVAQRVQFGDVGPLGGEDAFGGYELGNTPAFSMHPQAVVYFQLYVQAQPKGYFSEADVPTLEKLCVMNVLYDKAMSEYLERSLMQIDDVLGGEKVDPHFAMIMKLTDGVARLVKLLGLTPLDRGRPVVDKFGKPVVHGQAKALSHEESEHTRIQNRYWAKPGDNSGLN